MKANELMIGDCVRHKRTKEVIYIFEIDDDRNVINNEPDGYCSEKNIDIDDVEPIPLTPEILEKNGFKYNPFSTGFYECKTEDGNIACTMSNWWSFYVNDNIIPNRFHYVHELQHALKLCGIEKEIEL